MRKSLTLILIPAIALGGCAMFRGQRSAPDEFAVARNAPLVIPPDYGLTPPAPGTAASTPQDVQSRAIDALFGGPAQRPLSEMMLLDDAGRDRVALGARSVAGDPQTTVVDLGQTTRAIIAAPEANTEVASAQVP